MQNTKTTTSLINCSDKYFVFKDTIKIASSNTENGAWKLIGAKNKKDRESLAKYGFSVKENNS
jgi:hypothetical protein